MVLYNFINFGFYKFSIVEQLQVTFIHLVLRCYCCCFNNIFSSVWKLEGARRHADLDLGSIEE